MIATRWRSTIYRRPRRRPAMFLGRRGGRIRELTRRRRESRKVYASPRKWQSTGASGSRPIQSPSTARVSEVLFAILPTRSFSLYREHHRAPGLAASGSSGEEPSSHNQES